MDTTDNPRVGEDFSNPLDPRDPAEKLQAEEKRSGLETEEDDWVVELGEKNADNPYLPGQKAAELGLDHEVWPE